MTVDPALMESYRVAQYSVEADGERIELRVDQRSPALDEVLRRRGGGSWSLMTAHNPASRRRPDEENDEAQRALEAELAASGYVVLPARGGSPDGTWTEASVLAIDIDEREARRLMLQAGQNAYLVGRVGGPVTLRVTQDEIDSTNR